MTRVVVIHESIFKVDSSFLFPFKFVRSRRWLRSDFKELGPRLKHKTLINFSQQKKVAPSKET
ncbi:hypothetical protein Fmac_026320 [Flemingia macrophylla]|uniref:Ribosomal protein L32 n=1 Tax=Flemingia macrophylla TaxID=520843 RepID=A0ABD1LEI4_9FABA